MTTELRRECRVVAQLRRQVARFRTAQGGTVLIIFAAGSLVLLSVVGMMVDYSRAALAQSRLRNAADQAVLVAAEQLSIAGMPDQSITQPATAFIQSLIGPAPTTAAPDQIDIQIINNRTTVQATVTRTLVPAFGKIFNQSAMPVKVQTAARYLNGRPPLCALTLDPSATQTFLLMQTGKIHAPTCMVYSNSSSQSAISVQNNAFMKVGSACSVGGYKGSTSSFSKVPQTDCPVRSDPLKSRSTPAVGACTSQTTNVSITGGFQTLQPGTYCGGITIKNGAVVTLSAGNYILNGGQLWVTGGATMTGNGAGFFFTNGASLNFDAASTISLSAPSNGSLAGLLFFQDPSAVAGKDIFSIATDNATKLERFRSELIRWCGVHLAV